MQIWFSYERMLELMLIQTDFTSLRRPKGTDFCSQCLHFVLHRRSSIVTNMRAKPPGYTLHFWTK